jgi:hypothetical protein
MTGIGASSRGSRWEDRLKGKTSFFDHRDPEIVKMIGSRKL